MEMLTTAGQVRMQALHVYGYHTLSTWGDQSTGENQINIFMGKCKAGAGWSSMDQNLHMDQNQREQ